MAFIRWLVTYKNIKVEQWQKWIISIFRYLPEDWRSRSSRNNSVFLGI